MKKKRRKKTGGIRKNLNDFNNTNTFIYLVFKKKMDNVTKNRISNILYRYRIKENADIFNKLAEVILKKQIEIYKVIFNLIDACIIINENDYSIKIEIDSEGHRDLLNDIGKLFFIKVLNRRRPADFRSNLFFTVLIYKY